MKMTKLHPVRWLAAAVLFTLPATVLTSNARAAQSGAELFKAKCAMCHGQDASGNTPMGQKLKIRDLRTADVQKQTDAQLGAIITNGKPPMPAFGKTLGADDITNLVKFLRNLQPKA